MTPAVIRTVELVVSKGLEHMVNLVSSMLHYFLDLHHESLDLLFLLHVLFRIEVTVLVEQTV